MNFTVFMKCAAYIDFPGLIFTVVGKRSSQVSWVQAHVSYNTQPWLDLGHGIHISCYGSGDRDLPFTKKPPVVDLCVTVLIIMYVTLMHKWTGLGLHQIMAWHLLLTEPLFNTLRPRQNGCHFADNIFKCIFLNENVWIPIKISMKFVPKGPVNNIAALVQIMAWRRPGDKPLSEPMMVSLATHICVTRPQWVKSVLTRCQLVLKNKLP